MRTVPLSLRTIVLLPFLAFNLVTATAAAAPDEIPPAFGPQVNLSAKDFESTRSYSTNDRLVATYYFYWYDAETKGHILDDDGSDALTDHPPTLADFSYRSVKWHKQQLRDMMAAGIDIALPVFWGAPTEQDPQALLHWSYAGLPPLLKAREELLAEGAQPPRLGLFYDTSTLQWNRRHQRIDLTTDFGRRWFYATIRDFYSMIPPKHWAMLEGRPLVLLYAASFATAHDQSCVDYLKQEFPKEFGGRVPYLVRQTSWNVKADNTCAWGGALGLVNPGVASLGPGYDHSAVPGREPLIVPREGGQFYERQWLKFLRRPSNLVTVETWNEFHEGTDICESKEFGRQYLELTRKYVDLFKRGWTPPWPAGKYSTSNSVSITLGAANQEAGLRQIESEDGRTAPAMVEGRGARAIQRKPARNPYVYFVVEDSFKWTNQMTLTLQVDYFDAAPGGFTVEFDGSDPQAAFDGAYTGCGESVPLQGSKTWKQANFRLRNARLTNSQNSGADFRLVVSAPEFQVGRVTLQRP
jgi:hypothetical protein